MSGARPCGCSNRDPAAQSGWGLAVGAVAEQDIAHKFATAIRQKNDALIVNLSSLR